jgi:hypothetical protein
MATTHINAETQIRQWFHVREDLYLLVLGGGGPFGSGPVSASRQFYRANQIKGLDRIPEREVKSKAEARKIWGCPPVDLPSRYERLLEDDDEIA